MESLYRKYRPQTFADVVGQTHVVGTLERAVLEGRTSHAYLFCGPRGTGKTTMARLLAKALMCEQGQGHLPDGTCEQCRLIAAGEHPDVYELDAASRTGVDNVREEIINSVGYAPVRARYKLYIIDEVHMLTTAAFNALLKTLEEPPEHVIFVLCTTDPQKIPQTILSRVQRFDFRPISNEDIEQRLVHVCDQEGFTYEDEALKLVVANARGGMRDALSTLEQLSVFGGGTISAEAARDLLGALPGQELDQVVAALASRDVATLFQLVETLANEGRDLLQFVRELAARVRDVYVVQVVGDKAERVLGPAAGVERLKRDAAAFGSADRLARVLSLLGDVSREMAIAPNQRLVLEICFTRIARPDSDLTMESLAERIAELETRLASYEANPPLPRQMQASAGAGPRPDAEGADVAAPSQAAARPATASGTSQTPPPSPQGVGSRMGSQAAQELRGAPTGPQTAPGTRPQAPHGQQQVTPRETREATPAPTTPAPAAAKPAPSSQPEPRRQTASAAIKDAGSLQRMWKQVVTAMVERNPARGSLLSSSHVVSDDGGRLEVALPPGSAFSLKMLERNDVRKILDGCVSQVFGAREVHFSEGGDRQPAMGAQGPQVSRPQQPRQPQQAQQPAPAYRAPAPRPVEPARATEGRAEGAYPMPWDAPTSEAAVTPTTAQAPIGPTSEEPFFEQVPYEELGSYGFDEYGADSFPPDDYAAFQEPPAPAPQAQATSAQPAAPVTPPTSATTETRRQPAAPPVAAPAPQAPVASATPAAAEKRPPETPAQETKAPAASAVAAAPKSTSEPARDAIKEFADELSPELIAILENAFEVFGNDVKVKRER